MENTNYVGLSYQLALERRMDVIANNIANVNTSGYKSSHTLFNEYVVNAKNQKPMSMVIDKGEYRNFTPGPLQQTGNQLDVAIEGNGFFGIQTPDGEKYTRNGSFSLNSLGQLVNGENMTVSDEGGKPITIPAEAHNITISDNGTVSTEQGQVGKLKVVRFENPQAMTPIGNSLYDTKQQGISDAAAGTVHQGTVESSNVNPILEMTDMIDVLRRYESMTHVLENNNDMESSMISKLSETN